MVPHVLESSGDSLLVKRLRQDNILVDQGRLPLEGFNLLGAIPSDDSLLLLLPGWGLYGYPRHFYNNLNRNGSE